MTQLIDAVRGHSDVL